MDEYGEFEEDEDELFEEFEIFNLAETVKY